jgi:hypothetical protein
MTAASALARNDERFLAAVGDLSESEWARPSLCTQWSNHQVLAHLVHGCSAPIGEFTARMVATRGDFDAANTALARELAARRTPNQLLDDLERLRGNWRGLAGCYPSAYSSATT